MTQTPRYYTVKQKMPKHEFQFGNLHNVAVALVDTSEVPLGTWDVLRAIHVADKTALMKGEFWARHDRAMEILQADNYSAYNGARVRPDRSLGLSNPELAGHSQSPRIAVLYRDRKLAGAVLAQEVVHPTDSPKQNTSPERHGYLRILEAYVDPELPTLDTNEPSDLVIIGIMRHLSETGAQGALLDVVIGDSADARSAGIAAFYDMRPTGDPRPVRLGGYPQGTMATTMESNVNDMWQATPPGARETLERVILLDTLSPAA